MENVSKALIMAGGVLISIMVVSFMVLMLREGGKMSSTFDEQLSEDELTKFNSQFEIFHKDGNTFFDVVTVSNLAWNINKKNQYDTQAGVTIDVTLPYGKQKGNYKILIDKTLKKNYFFNDKNEQKYMYDLVSEYTQTKSDLQEIEYMYLFNCTNINYNIITGKISSMSFEAVENK